MSFEGLVDALQQEFDAVVDTGSDDELFMAGYLNGHYSLAVSQADQAKQQNLDGIDHFMLKSLEKAEQAQELSPEDFAAVKGLWSRMVDKQRS